MNTIKKSISLLGEVFPQVWFLEKENCNDNINLAYKAVGALAEEEFQLLSSS